MHQIASQHLNEENDLVQRTVTRVGNVAREREYQWYKCNIRVLRSHSAHAKRYDNVIKDEAAVHEERADDHQFSSEIRVRYHNLAITVVPSVLPVPFDSFHAFADASPMNDHEVILRDRRRTENQRAGLFQFTVNIVHLEINECAAEYKGRTKYSETDDVYEPV